MKRPGNTDRIKLDCQGSLDPEPENGNITFGFGSKGLKRYSVRIFIL